MITRNVSFDRLYISIPLAKWLLSQGITSIGILMSDRKETPEEIKALRLQDTVCTVFWEEPEKTFVLNSYIVKTKSKGLQNVMVLSSVQPLLGTTKDDKQQKPVVYKLYDFTKRRTNIVDRRIEFHSREAKLPK